MKKIALKVHRFLSTFLVDPIVLFAKWRAIPHFINNIINYKKLSEKDEKFKFSLKEIYFTTQDKFLSSGSASGHYFLQDLWAARKIFKNSPIKHVDVGSRVDGFVAHVLTFCKVDYVDIRPLDGTVEGLNCIIGSILNLPYLNNEVESLSCLHVIEHIGLGRYGDPVDPKGHIKAIKELSRVLSPGGKLYFSTPIGKERLVFDAHRVFSPKTIIEEFTNNGLMLVEFNYINDSGLEINYNSNIEFCNNLNYGCGLFVFSK
jgi:hypothetical protein